MTGAAQFPKLGLGLGLRNVHFDTILRDRPDVGWFEAISENFMDSGGRPRTVLRQIAERYPVVLHGVSLSIGSTDPLDRDYVMRVRELADEVEAAWVSDHLCWTGVNSLNSHDLLPMPLNAGSLAHVAARVHQVQQWLGRPLILENPSSYVRFAESTIDEAQFLDELAEQTSCGLLLDVNNVFVSCHNAGEDPTEFLARFPFRHVVQMHIAGHQQHHGVCIDTHDRPVRAEVWELFRTAWAATDGATTCLEWDDDIPDFATCLAELDKAKAFMAGKGETSGCTTDSGQGQVRAAHPAAFLVPDTMTVIAEGAA